jgi:tetratricopeptide (TPR) repeat protein
MSTKRQPEQKTLRPTTEPRMAESTPSRQQLQQCYAQAMQLMQEPTYDFDQAHALLAECVVGDPGNALYVDAFLRNLGHTHGDNPARLPEPAQAVPAEWTRAVADCDWAFALRAGPALLQHNPWDRHILQVLARACEARNWTAATARYLQNAVEASPRDVALNRQLANALVRVGRFDEAIACWRRVEETDPYDPEPPQMISRLTLEKARHIVHDAGDSGEEPGASGTEGGAARTESHPAAPQAAAPKAKRPRGEPRQLKLTHRQELEQAIINTPADEAAYLELAELHLAEHRSYDAQRTLLKALEVSKDLRIIEKLEDVNMLRAAEHLQTAEQRSLQERTPAAAEAVERLRQEKQQLEFEIFRRRCERYPQNKALQFQLGLRLKQLGNYRQALEPLQAGLEVPEHRALASLEIGEILQRYKMLPRALQCYRQAVQLAAPDPAQFECRRRALYRAATLAESMKIMDSSRQYWAELVRIAPEYKDARSRLDKLDGIGEDL